MFVFKKIWRSLFPSYLCFEIHPFTLLLTRYSIENLSMAVSVSCIKYEYVRCMYVCCLCKIHSCKISRYEKNTKKKRFGSIIFFSECESSNLTQTCLFLIDSFMS